MAALDVARGSISKTDVKTKPRLAVSKREFNGVNPNGNSSATFTKNSDNPIIQNWKDPPSLIESKSDHASKKKKNSNTTFTDMAMWDLSDIPRRPSSSWEEQSSYVLSENPSMDGGDTSGEAGESSACNHAQASAPPGQNGAVTTETGSTSTGTTGGPPGEKLQEIHRVTVVILGARGVGKSSLAQQFVYSEFGEEYRPTKTRAFFYLSVVVNERIYEVKLVDCPSVLRFPLNSLHEWNELRGCCLRNASAYLLVYDVTDDESFRYVRSMRDQIVRSRDVRDVPIFIAANKLDLLPHAPTVTSGGHGAYGASVAADLAHRANKNREAQSNVVRKQWKCGYMDCSAKYNWHVMSVFRELMRAVDHTDQHGHRINSNRVQNALHMERCVIL